MHLKSQPQATITEHVMMMVGVYSYPHTLVPVAALGCLFTTSAITQFSSSTTLEVYDMIYHSHLGTLYYYQLWPLKMPA